MIIKEAMRLFPPVGAISRKTTKDVVLGGYKVPKGTLIAISMFSIHHVSPFNSNLKISSSKKVT